MKADISNYFVKTVKANAAQVDYWDSKLPGFGLRMSDCAWRVSTWNRGSRSKRNSISLRVQRLRLRPSTRFDHRALFRSYACD